MTELFNPIINYHKEMMETNPVAGRELCRLNANHLKEAMGMATEETIHQVPIKAVRKLSSNKKKKKKKRRVVNKNKLKSYGEPVCLTHLK